MDERKRQEMQKANFLQERIQQLIAELDQFDPRLLANNTGATYEGDNQSGKFILPLWGRTVEIDFPGFISRDGETSAELRVDEQAVLTYYFHTSDGIPLSGKWISFSELPEGRFYTAAFQSYTGAELLRSFGEDTKRISQAAQKAGGTPVDFGDLAFSYQPLPMVALLVVYWQGDEDFPATGQVLFDSTTYHHLPTDVAAILGSSLVRRIIKAKQ